MALRLYGRHTSYNVQKVLWWLDYLKLAYQHTELGGRFGGLDSAANLALNPLGKVPFLQDGQAVIRESNTILRYLQRSYAGCPESALQQALTEQWMDWALVDFEPAFIGVFWGYYRRPAEQRDMAAVKQSLQACQRCLTVIGQQLANSGTAYLCGEQLSLADVSCGVFIYRLVSIDLPADLQCQLPAEVASWYARLQTTEGYQRWVMSCYKELAGRSDY